MSRALSKGCHIRQRGAHVQARHKRGRPGQNRFSNEVLSLRRSAPQSCPASFSSARQFNCASTARRLLADNRRIEHTFERCDQRLHRAEHPLINRGSRLEALDPYMD